MPLFSPPIKISGSLPIKVGGSPSAGAGSSVSAHDHVHSLTETAGPTNLDLGDILSGESVRRVSALLVGRAIEVRRLTTGTQSRSVTTMADVASQLVFALPKGGDFLLYWCVFYTTAATTTGLLLSMNFTGTVTSWRFGLLGATGATAMQSAVGGANDAPLGAVGVGPGGTERVAFLVGFLRSSTAGDVALRYASGVNASNVSILTQTHGLCVQQ